MGPEYLMQQIYNVILYHPSSLSLFSSLIELYLITLAQREDNTNITICFKNIFAMACTI